MPQMKNYLYNKKFPYIFGNFSSHPFFGQKKSLSKSKRESCPPSSAGLQRRRNSSETSPLLWINNLPPSQLLKFCLATATPPGKPPGNLCLIFVGRQVAIGHHVFDRRRSKEFQGKPPGITFQGGRPTPAKCRVLGIFQGIKILGDFFLVWMFYGVYLEKFFIKFS